MIPTYTTGTVSVSADGTVVTGNGDQLWLSNAKEGDWISIDGENVVMVTSVTDNFTLTILPWPYATKTAANYVLVENYSARDDATEIARDVSKLVAAQNKDGFIWFVGPDETEPDPSRGDEGQWAYQPSLDGTNRWLKTGGLWVFKGQSEAVFARYDVGFSDTDRPASGEVIPLGYPRGVTFRAGMSDSQAGAEVAATASAVFSLKKNGTQFATLTFGAASATGVIACPADTAFAPGDKLSVVAPNPRDATLSGVVATFIGYR